MQFIKPNFGIKIYSQFKILALKPAHQKILENARYKLKISFQKVDRINFTEKVNFDYQRLYQF